MVAAARKVVPRFNVSQGSRVRIDSDKAASVLSPATLATCSICRVSCSTSAPSSDSARITPISRPSSTTGNCVTL